MAKSGPQSPDNPVASSAERHQGVNVRGNLEDWGEPYFDCVSKLREQMAELQQEVAKFRAKQGDEDSDEARSRKLSSLMARLSGKVVHTSMLMWKQWNQKQVSIRKVYNSVQLRFTLRWRPLCFYKWLAMTEKGKRLRQEDIASMMKWEKDYQRELEKERIELVRTSA